MKYVIGFFIGIILFLGSFVLLWWNEGNNAEKINIADFAEKNAIQADANNIDRANDNALIAVTAPAITDETLSDGIVETPNSLVLDRTVEMYQWVENNDSDDNKTYTKEWSEEYYNSKDFANKTYSNPSFPLNSQTYFAKKAVFGQFELSEDQIEDIDAEINFNKLPENTKYSIFNDKYYSGKDINNPEIGDILISYVYAPTETDISIIGEQQPNNTITPMKNDNITVYMQYNGKMEKDEIIDTFRQENSFFTYMLRLSGWIVMFIGLMLIFNPVEKLLGTIPVLGNLANSLISIILGLITLVLSLITIAIAWFAYRPLLSLILLGISIIIFVSIKKLIDKNKNYKKIIIEQTPNVE